MKKRTSASFPNVGRKPEKKSRKLATRDVKISARIPREIAQARPPHLSWGEFIVRLVKSHKKQDLYWIERTLHAVWAANTVDYLAREIPARFPADPNSSTGNQFNRLVALAEFIQAIAGLRAKMEEIMYGR